MKRRECELIRERVRFAGGPFDQRDIASDALVHVRKDVARLQQALEAKQRQFAGQLERWTMQVEAPQRPFTIVEQTREAHGYALVALASGATEVFTAGRYAQAIDQPFLLGAGLALTLLIAIKYGLRFVAWDAERPRLALQRYRQRIGWLAWVSLFTGAGALVASLKLPDTSIFTPGALYPYALLLTTLSLLALTSILGVAHYILSWSHAADRDYAKAEQQYANVIALRNELERKLAELAVVCGLPALSPHGAAGSRP